MITKSKICRLNESQVGLIVVDLQERFVPVISGWSEVVQSSIRLIRFFNLLKAPILATEQYPKGLGKTVAEIQSEFDVAQVKALEKTTFSCVGAPGFIEALTATGRTQWVLCGIETHVCVPQTAIELLERGMEVCGK